MHCIYVWGYLPPLHRVCSQLERTLSLPCPGLCRSLAQGCYRLWVAVPCARCPPQPAQKIWAYSKGIRGCGRVGKEKEARRLGGEHTHSKGKVTSSLRGLPFTSFLSDVYSVDPTSVVWIRPITGFHLPDVISISPLRSKSGLRFRSLI